MTDTVREEFELQTDREKQIWLAAYEKGATDAFLKAAHNTRAQAETIMGASGDGDGSYSGSIPPSPANTEHGKDNDWEEALNGAVQSHRDNDLSEWELHLVGRRVRASLSAMPKVRQMTVEEVVSIIYPIIHDGDGEDVYEDAARALAKLGAIKITEEV